MKNLVRQKLADQNELAWRSLYPSHQLIASLESFAECQSGIEIPATRPRVIVLRVSNERIQIAGEPGTSPSKAIVVRVSMRLDLWHPDVVIVQMLHAVAVGGNWTWILSTDQYDAYSAGTCP